MGLRVHPAQGRQQGAASLSGLSHAMFRENIGLEWRAMNEPEGWLDGALFTQAWGWATAPITIYVNGRAATTVTPSIKRAGLDGQRLGFVAPLDPLQFTRGENEITVCFSESGKAIGNGRKKLQLDASPQLISGLSVASVTRGLWMMENVSTTGDEVELKGWFIAPVGVSGTPLSDGETISFDSTPDAMLQAQTWLPPELPVRRYEAKFRFPDAQDLSIGFGADGRVFNPDHTFIIPRDASPRPGRENISRVSGGGSTLKFDVHGITVADRLRQVFDRHSAAPLSEACVMDWGIGAGRVARFLKPKTRAFYGVDIDANNLAWCNENLQPGTFVHISTDPPTPLPSRHFDFIYGISVLTHLTREYERLWLAELQRLAKPDGVVALSIHGPTALMVMGQCHRQAQLADDGFLDLGENKVLSGHAPEGYYRNVAQSFAHLHQVWGEFFTIEEIMPGAIGNLQDLVVLKPR